MLWSCLFPCVQLVSLSQLAYVCIMQKARQHLVIRSDLLLWADNIVMRHSFGKEITTGLTMDRSV